MCLSLPLCLRLCLNVLCTSACHFLLCCGFSLFLHSPSFSSSLRVPVHYIPFLGGCKLNLFSCWTPHLRCPLSSLTGGLTSNEQPLELLKPATLNHFGRKHICVCVCLSVRTIFGLMALWFSVSISVILMWSLWSKVQKPPENKLPKYILRIAAPSFEWKNVDMFSIWL